MQKFTNQMPFYKRLFNIQRFSDDEETTPAADTEQSEADEPEKGIPKKYQDELDRIVEARLAKFKKEQAEKQSREAQTAKEKQEADRLAKLSDEQRYKEQIAQLTAEMEGFKAREKHGVMMAAARKELRTRGYSFDDAIVEKLVTDNADSTKAAIDTFVTEFDRAVQARVKEALKATPTPKAGAGKSTVSKEDILKLPSGPDRQRLIKENLHLFK